MLDQRSMTDNMDDFQKIIQDLEGMSVTVDDEDQAVILLNSLPERYKNFVETIKYGRQTLKLSEVQAAITTKDAEIRAGEKKTNDAEDDGVEIEVEFADKQGTDSLQPAIDQVDDALDFEEAYEDQSELTSYQLVRDQVRRDHKAPSRKYSSGAEKRKKKQRIEALVQSQVGSIDKFFSSTKQVETSHVDLVNKEHENDNEDRDQFINVNDNEEPNQPINDNDHEGPNQHVNEEDNEDIPKVDLSQELVFPLNIDDPGNWDKIDQNVRDFLVERGPKREHDVIFPRDNFDRHFSSAFYIRNLPNGEKHDRKWLVYSVSLDKGSIAN
ncbi:hypothetical protein EZV62_010385 [Acer yangbiense]|uniref:Retrovirus-related Pol polyprotein from transposon TNT 1-94 n=1 Tax=Acer yangbiense TaxID=1000413 RepID=A0A5C7I2E9_9ROSI|nr:hypothetical protein EZV62_010385 [Acer yangbiense]